MALLYHYWLNHFAEALCARRAGRGTILTPDKDSFNHLIEKYWSTSPIYTRYYFAC